MKISIIALTTALLFGFGASAQDFRLPDRHQSQHGQLLANQGNTVLPVESTTKYLEELFSEEEEPEFDIYTEGWDSKLVNCYAGVEVAQTAEIDVSKFCMPTPGYITSPYGYRRRFRRMHKGIDLKVNIGDTIRAAFDGRVRITNYDRKGYGYYVVIRHTNDLETVYGHLSKFLIEPDAYVKAGDPIALGGNTGRSTGPHLHFETRYMGYAINPSAIFDFANNPYRYLHIRQAYISGSSQLLCCCKPGIRQRIPQEKSSEALCEINGSRHNTLHIIELPHT